MGQTSIPQGYSPLLSIYETQKAIGLLKRLFEDRLSGALRLHRPERRPERRGAPGVL